MPTPLLVLFYLWLAVSVVILIARFAGRRRTKGPKPVKAADLTPTTPATPPPTLPTPTAAPTIASSVPAPAPAEPPPSGPAGTPPPSTTAPGGAGRPSASLMEALAGITLPCDLLPLTTVEGRTLGPRELVLATTGYSGPEVGRALGAALAALGYSITPLGSSRALAERGPDHVTLTIHDRPDTLLVGTRPQYPTAPADAVVVELRL